MFLKQFLIVLVLLLLFDGIMLGIILKSTWNKTISSLQQSLFIPRLQYGVIAYLLLTLGVYYFLIKSNRSVLDGFLLGLFVYGVFDFTNLTLFTRYPLSVALIDTLWGGVLFAMIVAIMKRI